MKLAMLAFSEKGLQLAERLKALLPEEISTQRCPKDGLRSWTEQHFNTADALVFIGATGIAVRAVAPLIDDKTCDPAVLVIDECAEFIIPLLSGHIGGANALAKRISASLGARAVITTATDCNGLFAIDSWATEQGYVITNPERIKQVSARLLSGEAIRLKSSFATVIVPELTREIILTDRPPFDVKISIKGGNDSALNLVPQILTLGVGCKKATPEAEIRAAFDCLCAELHLEPRAFCQVCSIDLKAKEPGLLAFCRDAGLPLVTFSPQTLAILPGDFTPSDFVRQITGVDNVCERSAVMGSAGTLLAKKRTYNGVTMAIARATHIVRISKVPPGGGAL
ncbi:cobalt-precorrin 5A hydrolase [Oscillospiraceae bacterium LTW-04]|nr:cobalt-precorrin 5A hydrolase [Oscillospiraceae bacterium MB24-C1]